MKKRGLEINKKIKEVKEKINLKQQAQERGIPFTPDGSTWTPQPNIYALTDPVLGGLTGAANAPIISALNNSQYLYDSLADLKAKIGVDVTKSVEEVAITDLNDINHSSAYFVSELSTVANKPDPSMRGVVVTYCRSSSYKKQIYYRIGNTANTMYIRFYFETDWSSWTLMADTNYVDTSIANLNAALSSQLISKAQFRNVAISCVWNGSSWNLVKIKRTDASIPFPSFSGSAIMHESFSLIIPSSYNPYAFNVSNSLLNNPSLTIAAFFPVACDITQSPGITTMKFSSLDRYMAVPTMDGIVKGLSLGSGTNKVVSIIFTF